MWGRHFEVSLAIWLALSWLIFRYPDESFVFMIHDFFIAASIATISLLNYKYRYVHLLNLIIAFWLIAFVFFSHAPITNAIYQNYMMIGLILLIFSVVPPKASHPPQEWEQFIQKKLRKSKNRNKGNL